MIRHSIGTDLLVEVVIMSFDRRQTTGTILLYYSSSTSPTVPTVLAN